MASESSRVTVRRHQKRVLIYSHDSFGLGHLRRCRAIAHSLVDADPTVSILILSVVAVSFK